MKLLQGDCLELMKTLPENSVDAIVTDPPYGLSFMNKHWDYSVPSKEIWIEALRVLKPGGHLLAFGGTRTYHRMVISIEDAGFEIRDQIMWIYGSGFPKSHNIGKAIDKASGVELEVVGKCRSGKNSRAYQSAEETTAGEYQQTKSANEWSGWGTALKPANEPIVVARKPLEKGLTVAENFLKYGTGAINIDGSRIGVRADDPNHRKPSVPFTGRVFDVADGKSNGRPNENLNAQCRWPANVIFDEEAGRILDEQSGERKSGGSIKSPPSSRFKNTHSQSGRQPNWEGHKDSGGASRFFYVAKASKRERGDGNIHPTIKPIKLMQYLINLVTPQDGTVLDPFMGSGSTGIAAKNLNRNFIGIELDPEYFKIAQRRINNESK